MSMGSSFEDLLASYEPPTELDIVIPGQAEPKVKDAAHGGGSGGSTGAAGGAAGAGAGAAAGSATPEPAPQLPEGSDPDEDLAEVADEPDEGSSAETAQEPEAEQEPESLVEDAPTLHEPSGVSAPAKEPAPVVRELKHSGGSLSFEGSNAYLKQFPKSLIDMMRSILEVHGGAEFASKYSQSTLVTAFVVAAMGVNFEADADTMTAIAVFRDNDPKLTRIKTDTATLLEQNQILEKGMSKVYDLLGAVMATTTVLEMGQAYALAERTAHLDTDGVMPETIDVAQKRVVLTRDNIRKRVKTHIKDEAIRANRPLR